MKLTKAMIRELRAIDKDGEPSDPYDWTHAPNGLWFYARDRVLDALLVRGLISDECEGAMYEITEEGQRALSEAA